MGRAWTWVAVVGILLTLVGGLAVLLTRDGSNRPSGVPGTTQPVVASGAESITATTTSESPAANRPAGTVSSDGQPVSPTLPTASAPATPQEVAELLAGLPLQLEQAANPGGERRELPPEEVDKIIEDMLRRIGAQP